jgi:hypothetical protein
VNSALLNNNMLIRQVLHNTHTFLSDKYCLVTSLSGKYYMYNNILVHTIIHVRKYSHSNYCRLLIGNTVFLPVIAMEVYDVFLG